MSTTIPLHAHPGASRPSVRASVRHAPWTLLLLAAACSGPPAAEVRPLPVRTLRIGADDATSRGETVRHAGVVVARTEAAVAFQVPGRIVARLVDVGQRVAAGTPLARLDAADLALGVESAQAAVRAADADAQTAAADLLRARDLHQQRVLPDAALERAVALAASTASRRDDARARLAAAQNAVRYTTLVSPAAGVVTGVVGEVGQVVAAGQPVVTVARDGEREVAIDVPEGRIGAIRRGTRADVALLDATVTDDAPATLPATVREVAPAADPATGTYRVRLALAAADRAHATLGRSVTVVFAGGARDGATTIPASALVRLRATPGVWVLGTRRDRVRFQPVEIARLGDGDVVIRAGLKPGDEIVTAGANRLDTALVVTPWTGALP